MAWEEDELQRLHIALGEGPDLRLDSNDSLVWKADPVGIFRVEGAVNWCESSNGPTLIIPYLIWHNPSPPKAQFLYWLVWKGRLKTSDYLHRIGILSDEVRIECVFCHAEIESLNHVLLLCPFALKVWYTIIKWWGLQWASPSLVVMLMHWWLGWAYRKREKQL